MVGLNTSLLQNQETGKGDTKKERQVRKLYNRSILKVEEEKNKKNCQYRMILLVQLLARLYESQILVTFLPLIYTFYTLALLSRFHNPETNSYAQSVVIYETTKTVHAI